MRELSLFTGGGGSIWAGKLLGWSTIGYVENNDYCQRVIRQRIRDGIFDDAPIFGDIRAFIGEGYADSYKGVVDVVTAGFPCQPFSVAGRGLGEFDPRNMWPETIECIRRIRPRYALLENVPGLIAKPYFRRILGDLAEALYDFSGDCLSAASFGAPHRRDRLWIVATDADGRGAYAEQKPAAGGCVAADAGGHGSGQSLADATEPRFSQGQRQAGRPARNNARRARFNGLGATLANTRGARNVGGGSETAPGSSSETEGRRETLAHAEGERLQRIEKCSSSSSSSEIPQPRSESAGIGSRVGGWWSVEHGMGRVVDGMANRGHRLRALGNGQIPIVAATAFLELSGLGG